MNTKPLHLQHPFTCGKMMLVTPFMNTVFAEAERAVATRQRAIAYEGASGHGKSTLSNALKKWWRKHRPEPVLRLAIKELSKSNEKDPEKAVQGHLLHAQGYPNYAKLNYEERHDTILRMMRATSAAAGTDDILGILDEANALTQAHLRYLKKLRIDLEDEDLGPPVWLCFALFGSEEMGDLAAQLINDEQTGLTKRYFIRSRPFLGIGNVDDLRALLENFDDPDIADFPVGASMPTTKFFFPQAWQAGWRMAKEAEALWSVMLANFPEARMLDIGMDAVTSVLKSFFEIHCLKDDVAFAGTEALWAEALKASDFLPLVNTWRAS